MKQDVLYLVVPCYNEEEMLPITVVELTKKMETLMANKLISKKSKVVLVNDGSKDNTWTLIENAHISNSLFVGLKLSRNCGHQNALLAGLMYAKTNANMVISLDADLQDDIGAIDKMIAAYYDGNQIVYGVRSSRNTDTFFKRTSAQLFYKLMKFLGVETVYNHADYRLMSRRALEELEKFDEVNLFLRSMIPLLGFKSTIVNYERHERAAGLSKYPLKKMLSFAFEGITSFSVKPIKMIMNFGILVSLVSIIVLIYALVVKLSGNAISGWTFTVGSIWLLGGMQMFAIGIIGEYIGKIYKETKHRPKYIVEKIID